jgi:tetratricopeptide (TPR) repeat protein
MRTVLALLLCGSFALADVVHLRTGGKIEGKVTEKGDKIEVETTNGKVTFDRSEVERIEKKPFELPKPNVPKKLNVRLQTSYAHPFLAFKLYLPPKWHRGKEQGSANASFWGPKDQAYQPRMDLRVEYTTKEVTDYVTAYKDAFRKNFKSVSFAFEEASAVRGRTGYQFCVLFTEGEPPIPQQALFTFVTDGERMYVLSFNCTQAWFERYYGMVDASMRSLRIYPAPKAGKEERQKFLTAYNAGEKANSEGKHAEALGQYQEAAQFVPEFADVHSKVGTAFLRLGRYADAEEAYKKAIEVDPEDYNHRYNLGVCYLKQSKYEDAIGVLKKAVSLEPTIEPGLTNLGAAYLGKDFNQLARETLEKAVETDPESAPAHYNLGLAYERLDRKKDAEREYKEAIKIDPQHEDARKSLDRLTKGKK